MASTTSKPSLSDILYHLVQESEWVSVRDANEPYYPATYDKDGFIHLTADPTLLIGVANLFYKSSLTL